MNEQPLLEVSDIHTYYGRAHILNEVSLSVSKGEVVALLGRNGAGKSTTLKSIIGWIRIAQGNIQYKGNSIGSKRTHFINRLGIGYVPEDRRIFAGLTVEENLEVGRQKERNDAPVWKTEKLFTLFPNLAEMKNRLAGLISGGEQQMLTIARTLMGNPELILLDEPSEGLAPVIVQEMVKAVKEMKNQGVAILLSEQNLRFATKVADRAYIIEKGIIRYQGSMKELFEDKSLRRSYLVV